MSSIVAKPAAAAWFKAFPIVFLAFMWGAAEGAFFFIVPDVLLTYIAIRHGLSRALWCALAAAFGAVEGGAIIYVWSLHYPDSLVTRLDGVTAISLSMIETAYAQMREAPVWSMLMASFAGMPFKLYAAGAPHAGFGLIPFLLLGFLVRLARFVVSTLVAAALARSLEARISQKAIIRLWFGAWVAFYAAYWSYVG